METWNHRRGARGRDGTTVLFSTDPRIASDDLVELADDRARQPAENVTPFVHRSSIRRFGPERVELIDAISPRLTTTELRALNGRVASGERSSDVAGDWVAAQALP